MRIGVDLMGSDSSPEVLFEAVLQMADRLGVASTLVVFATKEAVEALSAKAFPHLSKAGTARIEFHIAEEVIAMGDEPLYAVRHKKGSSLVLGVRLLKKRHIDALVCAGNTGALIASARLALPMLPGINRPALLAILPTQNGSVAVIDVGGNVSCKAHQLVQFAHMGAAYQRCMQGIELPKVGLLNIGIESKKGTLEIRQAYQILKDQSEELAALGLLPKMAFLGNIEGREVFQGKVDVLVTDGFTGNVLLKTTEGAASFIFSYMQESIKMANSTSLQSTVLQVERYFNYAEYPGAIVCGIDGVAVKCHGNSSSQAMFNGIKGAVNLIKKDVVAQIKKQLSNRK